MTRGTRPVPAIDSNAEDARLVGLVHVSDDDPGSRPMCHVFVGSKAPWHQITDDLPRYDGFPPGYTRRTSGEA